MKPIVQLILGTLLLGVIPSIATSDPGYFVTACLLALFEGVGYALVTEAGF